MPGPIKGLGHIAVNRYSWNFSLVSICSSAINCFLSSAVSFHWSPGCDAAESTTQQSLTLFPCIGQLRIFSSWEILHLSPILLPWFLLFLSPILIHFLWTLTSTPTLLPVRMYPTWRGPFFLSWLCSALHILFSPSCACWVFVPGMWLYSLLGFLVYNMWYEWFFAHSHKKIQCKSFLWFSGLLSRKTF